MASWRSNPCSFSFLMTFNFRVGISEEQQQTWETFFFWNIKPKLFSAAVKMRAWLSSVRPEFFDRKRVEIEKNPIYFFMKTWHDNFKEDEPEKKECFRRESRKFVIKWFSGAIALRIIFVSREFSAWKGGVTKELKSETVPRERLWPRQQLTATAPLGRASRRWMLQLQALSSNHSS